MIQYLTHPSTSQYLIAAVFLFTGIMHFVKTGMFVRIMPEYIPYHKLMVYISGIAEILGAVGVLLPSTRLWAGWGLVLLLIAVFPANIDMTVQAWRHQGARSAYFIITLLRLPLQFLLIYWVYWACIRH